MKLIHLKPEDYVVSTWSGGTTTQVCIAPEGAVYADRDFMWRISSATVDLESSDFTALPNYDRLISTLQGEIDLTHDGGEAIHLIPYAVHGFDGGWQTRSVGKCRDFNLMTRKERCGGHMTAVEVRGGETVVVAMEEDARKFAHADAVFYCGEGEAAIGSEGQSVRLQAGESALVRDGAQAWFTVKTETYARLILTEAWY